MDKGCRANCSPLRFWSALVGVTVVAETLECQDRSRQLSLSGCCPVRSAAGPAEPAERERPKKIGGPHAGLWGLPIAGLMAAAAARPAGRPRVPYLKVGRKS